MDEMRAKGEEVPADPFDSNCITPGTSFMHRLGKHLRFFIRKKMSEDPLWQTPNVVFSGEGLAHALHDNQAACCCTSSRYTVRAEGWL